MASNHQSHALSEVVVVMVPLPAQGHLNQLLHLSRLISAYDIPVHFVGTPNHNRQAKLRVHGWDQTSDTIHFHDFTIPHPVVCPPPNPNAPNKFPSHLQPTFEAAATHLRHPVAALLRKLASQTRRVVVIHDSLMASVIQDVGSIVNIDSYNFHTVSAFTIFFYLWEGIGCPPELEGVQVKSKIPDNMPSLEDCFPDEFLNFMAAQYEYTVHNSGNIYNASKIIEGEYVELLNKLGDNKKHWAIGPFNPVSVPGKREGSSNGGERHACLEWLDEQEPNSVIYVSFGTTTCMKDEQIKELAIGLEQSNQKFIWVLRDADKGNLFIDGDQVRKAELPEGYEERVKNRGVVVRDWAPQLEILSHKSTAWFLSHCGWNSCMESLTWGVPMACWPMHSDQPRNTVLVTRVLKVGVVIRDWERRKELITSAMVADGVGKLMGSGEVDVIRKKARELGAAVRGSMMEGGASRVELSSFIAHITR